MPLTNIKLINRNQVTIGGTLSAAGLTYPTADGANGQVITTDGNGTLTFGEGGGGGASVSISDTAPSSPSAGDMWFDSEDLILYVYYNDGSSSQWVKSIASGIPTPIALSATAPSAANEGDLWFDTNLLKLYIYYNDGDSNQWIEINSLSGNAASGGPLSQNDLDAYLQVANSTSFATTSSLDNYLQVANSTSFASTSQLDNYLQVANSTSFATSSSLDNYLQVANSTSFATTSSLDNYLQVANGLSSTSLNVITNAPSGNGSLSYTSSNSSFTFTPADLTENSPSVVYALTGTNIDPTNGGIQTKTVSSNTTFTESLTTGDSVVMHLNSGASYTITWPTVKWASNTAPTLTAADVVVFWKVSTTLYGAYVGSYA